MPDSKPGKISFESRDGFILQGEWHPAETTSGLNRLAAIISPGMGIPARFYRPFARHLARRGLDVMLFDFRGIGWSGVPDLSRLEANATIWGKFDLAAGIDQAHQISQGKGVLGIGHSFGGSIFGFCDSIGKLQSMVHICSQSGYYGYYSLKTRLYMLFNIHLAMPLLTRLLGYYPAHWLSGSEALPAGFVDEWSAWCLAKNYFMADRFEVETSAFHADYAGPLLSLSFDDDRFATRQSVDEMASFYRNSQLERRHLQPKEFATDSLGHFDVFKPANGRRVWDLITDWASCPNVEAPVSRSASKR